MSSGTAPAYQMAVSTIGARVKQVRSQLQLTQRELAKRLTISPGYLSDVENGQNKVNADILVGLILYFPELNPDWLLTGRGGMIMDKDDGALHDVYNLDVEAIKAAQDIFYEHLDGKSGQEAARLFANSHYFVNLMYRTYMTHFHAMLAQGLPESEARVLARKECEQLDKREVR